MKKLSLTMRFALKKTLPIAVSYFFVAMAFGLIMAQSGWNWIWAAVISFFIYTGAFQFVLASFLANGSPVLTVVFTALFMNSRQLFYGISFIEDFGKTGWMEPYMIHTLTDETYALYSSIDHYPKGVDQTKAQEEIALLAHFSWLFGTLAGSFAGSLIPSGVEGVDFALTALFITIVIDQWKGTRNHIPALTGLICSVLLLLILGPDRFLLPSLIITTGILFAECAKEEKA
jgi:4-azaleucine resistance transporter AzlC